MCGAVARWLVFISQSIQNPARHRGSAYTFTRTMRRFRALESLFHEGAAVLQPPGDTCISHSCKPVLVKEPSKQRPQRK